MFLKKQRKAFSQSRKRYPMMIGLLATVICLWLQTHELPVVSALIQRLDYLFYDIRLRATLDQQAPPQTRVVIADIDEKSLQEVGRWPWSRDTLSTLTQKIHESGAIVSVYDAVFPEPEANIASTILNTLDDTSDTLSEQFKKIEANFDYDTQFAEAISNYDVILGFIFHTENRKSDGLLPKTEVRFDVEDANKITIPELPSYTSNIALLQEAAKATGFVTSFRDDDGLVRRSPMIIRYGDKIYPSLSLEAARQFMLIDNIDVATFTNGGTSTVEYIQLGSYKIPTDAQGQVLVPYIGGARSFEYISASDILSGNIPEDALAGAIVMVGASALGIGDLSATPVASVFPGVEIHASILLGILEERFAQEPAWAFGVNFLLLATLGIILSFTFPFLGPLALNLIAFTLIFGLIGFNIWIWVQYKFVLSITLPFILLVTLGFLNIAYGFGSQNQIRKRLRDMFGQYVPSDHIDEMAENPDDQYGFQGESRQMTALFADIRNFTTISETLAPDQIKQMLNDFFTPMTKIIFERKGTIDKYIGDMIMAFWGAPLVDEDHAHNAVMAALEMIDMVEVLRPEFMAQGYPEINIGIGLNTGVMNVGDMGSTFRRSYTVLGDAVNLGSRLEGLTKMYGVKCMIGEITHAQTPKILCRTLDKIKVKGKDEAITAYEPVCHIDEASQALKDEVALYEEAYAAHLQQQWDIAEKDFERLVEIRPDKYLYEMYLERIKTLRNEDLPTDWDGVITMKTK